MGEGCLSSEEEDERARFLPLTFFEEDAEAFKVLRKVEGGCN